MNARIYTALLATLCLATQSQAQGTVQPLTITFDGPPAQATGTSRLIQQYSENGLLFTPIATNSPSFVRQGGGVSFFPENGTTYLQAAGGNTLMFSQTNGGTFSLLFVDLAEYSTVVPNAVTVHFIGYHADGSTVTADLTTDGIIDGTGPLADFQTFGFQKWVNLVRVEIPSYGWSLDNLVVGVVPEPTSGALVLMGGLVLWQACRRRHV